MRVLTLLAASLTACSFSLETTPATVADAPPVIDVPPDQAPPTERVRFTSITADRVELYPGLYGVRIRAVLRNDLATEITDIGATLTFASGATDRSPQFRWRDRDGRENVTGAQPLTIPAGDEATFEFMVDALASAAPPDTVEINGSAVFTAAGMSMSATALDPPLDLAFRMANPPITVTTATDENTANGTTSLREAISLANANGGPDRIVFDLAAFPAGTITPINLVSSLDGFPSISQDLVIDGEDRVVLALASAWESAPGRWGLRLTSGTLVVANLTFRKFGFNYANESISTDGGNCGGGTQLDGGAIRVDGGTLILDGNVFTDAGVAERNCYAASLRIEGGSAHRIVHNTWTDQVMDSMLINAPVLEISDNLMNAGANPTRVDDCIAINSQGNTDLWIIGNVCVDQEYNAILSSGNDSGQLHIMHNTFVRNGRVGNGAIRRSTTNRVLELRNNVYVSNNPSALVETSGTNINASYETLSSNPLCNPGCPNATVVVNTMVTVGDVEFTNGNGSMVADFLPRVGSPLVDTGVDLIDRNGSLPRRFNGTGVDRGAVERP